MLKSGALQRDSGVSELGIFTTLFVDQDDDEKNLVVYFAELKFLCLEGGDAFRKRFSAHPYPNSFGVLVLYFYFNFIVGFSSSSPSSFEFHTINVPTRKS